MFCNNCGNQLNDADKFCRKCGTPVDSNHSKEFPPQRKKPNTKIIYTCGAIVATTAIVILLVVSGAFHSHSISEKTIKEPTCTESGIVEKYCTKCDFVEQEEIKSTGHDWVKEHVIKEATCTQNGSASYKCSKCGITEERTTYASHTMSGRTCVVCGYQEPLPELSIGMTKSQVKSKWGEPIDIDKSTSSRGTEETWWYKDNGKTIAVNFDVDGKIWLISGM